MFRKAFNFNVDIREIAFKILKCGMFNILAKAPDRLINWTVG